MPISLLIKPASSACNMRCKYCFYADVADHRSTTNYGMMSLKTLETLVKSAFEYSNDFCSFAFQGGEPTCAGIDFFRHLIRLQEKYNTKKLKINNSIQTNGFAVDDEWAEFFANNNFLVGLSLDGTKDVHDFMRPDAKGNGTFSRIMKTVDIFNKHNVQYNILSVVNNFVARRGESVYNFFKKQGFKYLQFIPCLDSFDGVQEDFSLSPKRYGEFLKTTFDLYYNDFMSGNYISIRNFDNYVNMVIGNRPESCGMSGVCTGYFVIEGDGSVYPCDFYVLDKYCMGNIRIQNFSLLAKSDVSSRFVEESKFVDEKCRGCRWLHICRGGCRRHREPFSDGKPVLNRFCESYQMFFEHTHEKLRKMAAVVHSQNQR